MDLINSLLGFVIAIGILVTFHEYGHFIVARICNVKVLKFSVGFGKSLIKFQSDKNSTEYSLCMIPLGGYVQMLESKTPDGQSNNIDKQEHKYCFDKKNVYQRFAIVAAGPIFNLILAIIFFTMTYLNGIGGIKPTINVGDSDNVLQIVSVNNTSVKRWQDVRIEILNNVMNDSIITMSLKDSNTKELSKYVINYDSSVLNMEGDIIKNIGLKMSLPYSHAIIGSVSNQPNNKNIRVGDKIVFVDNKPIKSWIKFVEYIHNNPDKTINIIAVRKNKEVQYTADILTKNNIGYLGVSQKSDLSSYVIVNYSFKDAIAKAFHSTTDYTILTFKMIGRLVIGEANVKNLSGPLSIAQFSGKSLEMGLSYFLFLLAVLSVSLGVLNLLPIPMLDGGHLAYYTYEMLIGKEIPYSIQMGAQFIGLAILGLIMIVAFYNDFVRIFA
jgi:regulator of sigma E protease